MDMEGIGTPESHDMEGIGTPESHDMEGIGTPESHDDWNHMRGGPILLTI
ncbi:unnamed protein product [Staurois parvus]|uniref:Uncharacterized protein n=1 Tax=Staurois parvus TaxID=386267 RepID=A0ABN9HD43_9NEOB|nr:unnamed protein product [Staurois parvus]